MSDSATHHLALVLDADPMAHFPSEHVAEERAANDDLRPPADTAPERDSLLAFVSEASAPIIRPAAPAHWTARIHVIQLRAVTTVRAAAVRATGAARHSRRYVANAAGRCLMWCRATAVQAQGALLVVLALTGGVTAFVSVRVRTLTADLRTYAGPLHVARLPHAFRRHVYPAAFFLSGVVVGAALVAFARWPPASVVTTAVASKTQIQAPIHDRPSPAPAALPTVPDRNAPDDPVATSGTRTAAAQRAVTSASTDENRSSRPAPYHGSLVVNSRPQGADVFLNGRRVGTTPLVLDGLPVGSRAVRLVRDGHETWSRALDVVANQRTTVTAMLQPARPE